MAIEWPKELLNALEQALSAMPASLKNMALSRLIEDVETRVQAAGRVKISIEDVLLAARNMVSGRMYEGLETALRNLIRLDKGKNSRK